MPHHPRDSDSSSSSSSSSSGSSADSHSDAEDIPALRRELRMRQSADLPPADAERRYLNCLSKLLHKRLRRDAVKLVCSKPVNKSYSEVAANDGARYLKCIVCFKP